MGDPSTSTAARLGRYLVPPVPLLAHMALELLLLSRAVPLRGTSTALVAAPATPATPATPALAWPGHIIAVRARARIARVEPLMPRGSCCAPAVEAQVPSPEVLDLLGGEVRVPSSMGEA